MGIGRDLEPLTAEAPSAHWVPLGRQQQRQWRSLLALELLDAMAVAEMPELCSEEAAQLALVEVRPRRGGQVVLICRRDPLVLEIFSRMYGWMELP
jgi:hypothetical protein